MDRRIALLAVGVATLAAMPAASASGLAASLRLVDRAPLTVRGAGFEPRERVRLTASVAGTAKRLARASATGTFTAAFVDVRVDRCSAVRVAAVGANGSSATLKLLPSPACAPD